MRPFRFAIHLRDFGWEPIVLSIATPDQKLTEKEASLLKHVEVIEIRTPFDRTNRSESHLGPGTNSTSNTTPPAERRKAFSSGVLANLDRQFPTDTWLLLFAARYRALCDVIRRVRPDVLWSTGDPWSALVTMRSLAERFKLPWVADFRDPWTLSSLRTARQWSIPARIDRFLERKVVASADAIVFQAASVAEAYRRHYVDLDLNTHVIFNSFDPCVFDEPIRFEAAGRDCVSTDGVLRIGFFGRFRALSPATLIINALAAARRENAALASRIEIHSFGPLNEEDAADALQKGVFGNFHRAPSVPLERSLGALRRFDLLLVSTDEKRDQIIPAKIFEYLAAGRPILSLSLNDEVDDILSRTRTGIQLDPRRPEKVAGFMMECLRAVNEGQSLPIEFRPEAGEIARYEARHTTRELAGIFDRVISDY